MYVIKMNRDKSLIATIRGTIYQYERNVDTLVFLIPCQYDDQDIANFKVLMQYILPDGSGKSDELVMDFEPYKGHYKYSLPINSDFTTASGRIELWLNITTSRGYEVLKSGTAYIDVLPRKNITEYLVEEDDKVIYF